MLESSTSGRLDHLEFDTKIYEEIIEFWKVRTGQGFNIQCSGQIIIFHQPRFL